MLSAILAFFGAIPGIGSIITSIVSRVYDAKVAIKTAEIGGNMAVAKTLIEGAVQADATRVKGLQVIAGSWVLAFLTVGFALPFMIYEWKIVVFDIVFKLGTTDPIRGAVIDWGSTIITCLFGSGTVLAAGHMYFNRRQTP